MKKKLLFVLASSVLALTSCGGTPATSSPASTPASETSSTSASTPSSTPVSQPVSTPASSEATPTKPTLEGRDVVYIEGLKSGGEANAVDDGGFLYAWCGDGGSIESFEKGRDGSYNLTYSACGTPSTIWGWYSVQIFYNLPYAELGDVYKGFINLNSDAAGDITVNGKKVSLVVGDNYIEFDNTQTVGKATLSIQLGVTDGTDASTLAGYMLKIKELEIHDAVNTYHEVKFTNGNELVKDIDVRSGKLVSAPKLALPQDKVLTGWFENEVRFDATAPVTADHSYAAKVVNKADATLYTVTYKFGDTVIGTEEVVEGSPAEASPEAPYGYELVGVYSDAELTTPYTNGEIIAATTLYVKLRVKMTTYRHDSAFSEGQEITHGENGEWILTYPSPLYDQAWHIQANFAQVPHEAGKMYQFSTEYKLSSSNKGSYQLYDKGTVSGTSGELVSSTEWTKVEFIYAGSDVTDSNYFTFELGLVRAPEGEENVVFQVRNVKVEEAHVA